MKKLIESDTVEHEFGALVVLRALTKFRARGSDELEDKPEELDIPIGVITGFIFRPSGVVYIVSWSDKEESHHYSMELSPA